MVVKKCSIFLLVIVMAIVSISACGSNTEQTGSDPNGDDTITNEVSVDVPAVGDTITFGSYEQDNNISNGPEKIEWQVLAVEGTRVLAISKYILDAQPYNRFGTASVVTWETCTLNNWLLSFMHDAFNEEESSMIPVVTVNTGDNSIESRIFLLSTREIHD